MNKNSSVAVLLAAYNGINWIKEQVESILNQTDVDIDLFISVDLSNDGTYEWCKELTLNNKNVKLLKYGDRFGGAAKNFFRLIKDVDLNLYDYVSLADQDDIWIPNKLSNAIKLIKDKKLEGYSSDVIAFSLDGQKKLIKKSFPQKKFDYYFESAGPGCTFLFKQKSINKFKIFLLKNWSMVNQVKLHDWMIYAFFRSFSMPWYIDKIPSVYYRQHNSNEVGANNNLKAYLIRFLKIKDKWYRREVEKIVYLLKENEKEEIILDRKFLILNFYKLRRSSIDSFFLLLMNILRIF